MSEVPIGLELPSGAVLELPDLTPVRMLNEYSYCPRLAYLMWVQGEFEDNELRRLVPTNADTLPMYVHAQGGTITKDGDFLQIREDGHVVQEARLGEVSHIGVFGNVQVSAQAINDVCRRGISITHFSYGGWFHGITHGMSHKNVELRLLRSGSPIEARSLVRDAISRLISASLPLPGGRACD